MKLRFPTNSTVRSLTQIVQRAQRRALGRYGERLAAKFLRRNGYVVWKKNWRGRRGEIDIVAYDRRTLCVVEVKTRSGFAFGPFEAVTAEKFSMLQKLSYEFRDRELVEVRRRRLTSNRIDAVGITILPGKKPVIQLQRGVEAARL